MFMPFVAKNWRRFGLGAAALALAGGAMVVSAAAHATTTPSTTALSVAATDVSVSVSTASRAPIGKTLPATVLVTNRGPAATTVKTFVRAPAGVTIVAAKGGAVLDGGRTAQFDQPTLLPGQNVTHTFTYVGKASGNKVLVVDAVPTKELDYSNNFVEHLVTFYYS